MNLQEIISTFALQPHPEGGYYKETYRCKDEIETERGKRNISTAIYFLLEGNNRSNFHRIKSDELWFFHHGNAIEIFILTEHGLKAIALGNDLSQNESPQAVIPANCWFASHVKSETGFALVSCTVAPGFDFRDFELADRQLLTKEFPDHRKLIEIFTTESKRNSDISRFK
jgi:predicted cupin superfamily sugar epimerase